MKAMQEDVRAACVLVLVTGLPGAGKTSCVKAVVPLLVDEGSTTVRLFSLDAFLHSKSEAFSPAAWRNASADLYAACEQSVQAQLQDANSPLLILLVDDNMHYHSMRERYWRLCTRLSNATAGRAVALLETRFSAPVALCLQRNEGRRGTRAYVPPHVIQAMHEVFEECLRDEAAVSTEGETAPSSPSRLWHLEERHWKPWPLIAPHPLALPEFAASSAEVLATDFLELLLSRSVTEKLQAQIVGVAKRTTTQADREKAREQVDTTNTFASVRHRLDLALRALVKYYFQSLDTKTACRLQRPVQELKKAVMSSFKSSHGERQARDEDAVDQMFEDAITDFQTRLGEL